MTEPTSASQIEPAIFVHGMWRTASTYFWHKFRVRETNRAYLEPLHEYLFDMPERALRDFLPIEITSLMRHPKIDRFYFEEYPLRPEGGVSHFRKRFSYQHYHLDPGESDPELESYITSLLQLAWSNGQRPVLQFNRALLRAGWLAKRFESYTILLLRDPFDTWKSFLSIEGLYFPTVISMIVGQNGEDPLIGDIARTHEVPAYFADSFMEEYKYYHAFATAQLDTLYPVFYELCLLANVYAAAYSDVVIDVNEVSSNDAARIFVAGELKKIGIDMTLDDCAIPTHTTAPGELRWPYSDRPVQTQSSGRPGISTERLEKISPGLGQYWQKIFMSEKIPLSHG